MGFPRAHFRNIIPGGGSVAPPDSVYQGFLSNNDVDLNPTTAGGVTIFFAAGPNVYGGITQLHAGLPQDYIMYEFLVGVPSLNVALYGFIVQFGFGPLGLETWYPVEIPFTMGLAAAFTHLQVCKVNLPMGVRFPAGQRIVVRGRQNTGAPKTGRMLVRVVNPATTLLSNSLPYGKDTLGAGVYSYNEINNSAVPIGVVTGGAADVYGAGVQVIAATAVNLWITSSSAAWLPVGAGGDAVDIQYGIGPNGAEVWGTVARFKAGGQQAGFSLGVNQHELLDSGIFVPAGSRVAMRAKGTNAGQAIDVLTGVTF